MILEDVTKGYWKYQITQVFNELRMCAGDYESKGITCHLECSFWILETAWFLLIWNLTLNPLSFKGAFQDLWFGSKILVYVWGDNGCLIAYRFIGKH